MSPDDLIKFFHLEAVITSESFSDEDEEDSGSNDRKVQNKAQNEYMRVRTSYYAYIAQRQLNCN